MFWPTQSFNVYGHDPIAVGIRNLPIGFSILAGASTVLLLLSYFRGYNRELMVIATCMMTGGVGAMASLHADTANRAWGLLVLAGLGVGGIIVPASIISQTVCPDDLIATVTALTLSIRVIGGSIGFTVYYNVFYNKFIGNAIDFIGGAMKTKLDITDPTAITQAIKYTSSSALENIKTIPAVANNSLGVDAAYQIIVVAGQTAYAESYQYVYLVSIAFGAVAIIASLFLKNINKLMDNHVAVVM